MQGRKEKDTIIIVFNAKKRRIRERRRLRRYMPRQLLGIILKVTLSSITLVIRTESLASRRTYSKYLSLLFYLS